MNNQEDLKKLDSKKAAPSVFTVEERRAVDDLYQTKPQSIQESVNRKLKLKSHDKALLSEQQIPQEELMLTPEEEQWLKEQDKFNEERKNAHNEAIAALKNSTVMEGRNAFGMDIPSGDKVIETRLKKEKTLIDNRYKLIRKAIGEFSEGSGGKEFMAVKEALRDLTEREKIAELWEQQSTDPQHLRVVEQRFYEAVMQAAREYVRTHNRMHFSRQGSRRLNLAKILSEDIMNMDYLKERSATLEEEINNTKQDAKSDYVMEDDIKEVSENLEQSKADVRDAFKKYSDAIPVFKVTELVNFGYKKPAGVEKSDGMYNPYQFMNAIKRGAFTREDIENYYNNYEENYQKKYNKPVDAAELERIEKEKAGIYKIYEQMAIMDSTFDNSTGLKETSKLYRGYGTIQLAQILQMDVKELNDIGNPELRDEKLTVLEKKLEGLVGKVYTDDGFTSTSMDPSVARDFAFDNLKSPIGFMFDIVARKGTKGIDIDDVSMFNGSEREILLKPGTKFLIRGFEVTKHFSGRPIVVIHSEVR